MHEIILNCLNFFILTAVNNATSVVRPAVSNTTHLPNQKVISLCITKQAVTVETFEKAAQKGH